MFPRAGEPAEPVAATLFARINRDRREHGLEPLRWDERAAAVARSTTRRQIEERTFGHFLLDGFPPYARLSAGEDFGMGSENVAAFMSDAGRLHDTPEGLVLEAQREMMRETPPHDFHRRTILDADATHVGIGWAMEGGEFRVGAEFSARGYERIRLARERGRKAGIRVDGQALAASTIRYVTVSRQPAPGPITRGDANGRETYSYPSAQLMLLPESSRERAIGIRSVRSLSLSWGGNFFFSYPLDAPGLWTFVLYFQRKAAARPEAGGSITLLVEETR